MSVDFRDEAIEDFDEAFTWYENKRVGLGVRFANAVNATLAKIVSSPTLYRKVRGEVRKCTMKQFPYAIHYMHESGQIQIIAIFHTSRDPNVWLQRLP